MTEGIPSVMRKKALNAGSRKPREVLTQVKMRT